jgi:hypothetical protein
MLVLGLWMGGRDLEKLKPEENFNFFFFTSGF